jgi:phospholipase C
MPSQKDIQHFVLVMMENRSFDHYLGALNFEGRDDIEGLGKGPLPVNRRAEAAADETGPGVAPWPMDDVSLEFRDPPHEWREVREQWNGGRMDGFVATYQRFHETAWDEAHATTSGATALQGQRPVKPDFGQMARAVMGYYTRRTLPVLYGLADEFAVCDHWFSSFLGSTHPNRVFAQTGFCGDVLTTTVKNAFRHKPQPIWAGWEKRKGRKGGITWKTYFHPRDLSMFALWPGFAGRHDGNAGSLADFAAACRAGELPDVAIVEPPYSVADDHPAHDPRRGQQFLGFVVNALLKSRSWASSALILYYDEHGGFFDHVPPPAAPEAGPPPRDQLGLRIPAVVVSPFTPRRVAVKDVLEHVSVLKTIAERWDLALPAEAGPRLPLARSLWDCCFDLGSRPRPAPNLTLQPPRAEWRADVSGPGELRAGSDYAATLAELTRLGNLQEMERMLG